MTSTNAGSLNTLMYMSANCSTCKWAEFGRPAEWLGYSGKKQMGICFVECDGMPPKVISHLGPAVSISGNRYRGLKEYARAGYTMSREEYLILAQETVEKYFENQLNTKLRNWQEAPLNYDRGIDQMKEWKDKWRARITHHWVQDTTREEYVDSQKAEYDEFEQAVKSGELLRKYMMSHEEHYDTWLANYMWWQENWPRCRRCHRAITCDAYKFVGGQRENVARSIARGNGREAYSLHKENKNE